MTWTARHRRRAPITTIAQARCPPSRTKRFNHPVVGEGQLAVTAEPGLALFIYTAEPGSPSAERLRLLASWSAQHLAEIRAPEATVAASDDTDGISTGAPSA